MSETVSKILSLYKGKQNTPTRLMAWSYKIASWRCPMSMSSIGGSNWELHIIFCFYSVVLVGHSLGGVIGKALFTLPGFPAAQVLAFLKKEWREVTWVPLLALFPPGVHAAHPCHPPHTSCALRQTDSWLLHQVHRELLTFFETTLMTFQITRLP